MGKLLLNEVTRQSYQFTTLLWIIYCSRSLCRFSNHCSHFINSMLQYSISIPYHFHGIYSTDWYRFLHAFQVQFPYDYCMSSGTKEIKIVATVFVIFFYHQARYFCHHYIPNNYNTTNFFRDIMFYSNEPPSVFECLVKTEANSTRYSIFSLTTQAMPVGNYPGKWQRMIWNFQ